MAGKLKIHLPNFKPKQKIINHSKRKTGWRKGQIKIIAAKIMGR